MRWSERQQALLRGIGIRLWLPGAAAVSDGAAASVAESVAEASAEKSPFAAAALRPAPAAAAPALLPAAVVRPPSVARPAALPPAAAVEGERQPATLIPVAALDWPALRDAVAACRACALCESRRQTVFGVGHPQARCMVVGEAPGEQEDQRGEPFVGAAGQLLDRMLLALGLSREDGPPERQVFIANALKCRPPRNRNPQPDELATCQPFLLRQVALVQPRVIIAMGRFAVQSLLGSSEPIGRLRGRLHDWQGRPLVVTYHPAYLLRQPADKAKAWDDLCLAAQCMEGAD